MTQFDEALKGALDADDETFLRKLDEERGLFAQIGDTLAGPLGGWAKLVAFGAILLVIAMAIAVWKMLTAETDRGLILWTAAALAALFVQGMIKQWFFARMNVITLLRTMKRMELRIARIEEAQSAETFGNNRETKQL